MIRQDLYRYRENKRKIIALEDKIAYLRAKAEKTTPTLSDDVSFGFSTDSKVERNAIKILEVEDELEITKSRVKNADDFLDSLKPYHRHIITLCIVNHIPYKVVAKREKISPQNISQIINKVIQ